MMGRRALLSTVSVGVVALALGGCTTSQADKGGPGTWQIPSKDPTATIKVLTYYDDASLKPILDDFKKKHPTITVEFQSVPWESLNQVIQKEVPAKDGDPDVYLVDGSAVAGLNLKGYSEDLTAQFSTYAGRWDKAAVEAATVDGKLSALPLDNSSQLLFYNKDLLDKAGIPAPSPDPSKRLTWEQVTDQAKKALKAGAANGLLFDQSKAYYQLQPLPVSLGGSPGGSGKGNLTPDVTSDAWVKAMTWYSSIFKDGVAPRSVPSSGEAALFEAGKAAFLVDGNWEPPTLVKKASFNWGVAPMPYFEGGKPVTPTGSFDIVMNPFSKNKEAAAIFMKYLTVDGGCLLTSWALPPSADDRAKYYQQGWADSPRLKEAARIMDYELQNTADPRLRTVGYPEFEEIMNRTFSDIQNGADPGTALNAASEELKSAWAKYQ